jgi:hypothetical protein
MSDEELAELERMNPLVISDETGAVIFQLLADGTAELPDPDKAPLAAAIFWREVLAMAELLGVPVSFHEPTP